MKAFYFSLCLSVAAAFLSSCKHHAAHSNYQGPTSLPVHLKEEFKSGQHNSFKIQSIEKKRYRTYDVETLRFNDVENVVHPDQSHQIDISIFKPRGYDEHEKMPVVMMMPILGGNYFVSRRFCTHFVKRNLAVVLVHRHGHVRKVSRLMEINSILKQIIKDHIYVLDWMTHQSIFDSKRIGSMGVSTGAIKNCLVTAIDGRMKASVMALVGGDLPTIFCESDEPSIVRERKKLMAIEKLNKEELHVRLRQHIKLNPIHFADTINARDTLVILAKHDDMVPYEQGLKLIEKIGNPQHITIEAGHITALAYIPYLQTEIYKFFKEKLTVKD